MLPSLQPSRPKYPPCEPNRSGNHQQTRSIHRAESVWKKNDVRSASPKSQVEAMPPSTRQPASSMSSTILPNTPLAAIRHPVFFTERLRKPPFPLPAQAEVGSNPVAFGYVWEPMVVRGYTANQGKPNL